MKEVTVTLPVSESFTVRQVSEIVEQANSHHELRITRDQLVAAFGEWHNSHISSPEDFDTSMTVTEYGEAAADELIKTINELG